MTKPVIPLRVQAETLAAPLPPLMAQAEHLASTVMLGDHGRRRAGIGDTFWQFRAAQQGDEVRMIDWRRSAKSDTQFVQDKEWQIAQTVQLWVDTAASMTFASDTALASKLDRAKIVSLAVSILMLRAGERIGLTGFDVPPRSGIAQVNRLAEAFSTDNDMDFGAPDTSGMLANSRAIFVSDFLGDMDAVTVALTKAADRGVKGAMLQVLDPAEEAFPFNGRTVFESMTGALRHETLHAGDLRDRYLDRLAERKDQLSQLARATGWQFTTHHTNAPAQTALLWLYSAMERPV